MRDDFPKKIKDLLASRVGYRCSNPKCKKVTVGPNTNLNKSVSIGVASHIFAAAEGGPRFDPGMQVNIRKSFENGIWLCQNCAKLIDSDLKKYTPEFLRDWKETAEHWALAEVQGTKRTIDQPQNSTVTMLFQDFKIWKEERNLPGYGIYIISQWASGDIRYSFTARFKNHSDQECVLHRLRVELDSGTECIYSDNSVFSFEDIVLPPLKWTKLEIAHGFSDLTLFNRAESIWFKAEIVGEEGVLRGKVTEICPLQSEPK